MNDFIEQQPDFSYYGARAVIAVTGYEGVFVYHNATPPESSDYGGERRNMTEIADKMKADGYVFASHTYSRHTVFVICRLF